MKISIVTISFNQRGYLEQAIDSVLTQDGVEVEYIVVDPGSSDGSRELVSAKLDGAGARGKTLFERDAGPADGLNKGFALATGDIYGFVNSDDYLLPGALAAVERCFLANPDAGIVAGNGFIVDGEGRPKRHIRASGFTLTRFLHGGTVWIQQSTFFRASSFKQVGGFNLANRTSWDGELLTAILKAGASVAYVDQDLACFRIHELSITGGEGSEKRYLADRDRVFQSVYPEGWTLRHRLIRLMYRAELFLRSRLKCRSPGAL